MHHAFAPWRAAGPRESRPACSSSRKTGKLVERTSMLASFAAMLGKRLQLATGVTKSDVSRPKSISTQRSYLQLHFSQHSSRYVKTKASILVGTIFNLQKEVFCIFFVVHMRGRCQGMASLEDQLAEKREEIQSTSSK